MGVSNVSVPRRSAVVAEETKELILAAAETEFAYRGFASARLEDMADRVGITRAAIIYHFGDKQALYGAVLEAAFHSLAERMSADTGPDTPHAERVEKMIDAWIEISERRPTLARLFMREVADSRGEFRPEVDELFKPIFGAVQEAIEAGQRDGTFRAADPRHLIRILAGATTWYATNPPLFGGHGDDDIERNAEEFAAYRRELIGVTRFLLGTLNTENES